MASGNPKGERWPIDGTQHHDVGRNALYRDGDIEGFLSSQSRTLLVACKGMGKTLLLRSKKRLLESEPEGVLIIPRNAEYDEPQLHGDYSTKGMDGLHFWEDLWNCAIVFSILTHGPRFDAEGSEHLKRTLEAEINALDIYPAFKERLLSEILNKQERLPSDYLSRLLELGVKAIKRLSKSSHHVASLSVHLITSGVSVFIDAFDQTLTDRFAHKPTSEGLDVWRFAQLGLARSAHKLNTRNKHIKVYATIRQEAWSGFENDDREVMRGRTCQIQYSEEQLRQMFIHAVKRYSGLDGIESFFGLKTLHNSACYVDEDPFSYLYRHSIGSARSVMTLGSEVDLADVHLDAPDLRAERIKTLINNKAAENAFKDYLLGQRKVLLNVLKTEERIRTLLSLIPGNVLMGKSLKVIHGRYCEMLGLEPAVSHPFCELFNVGLLGETRPSVINNHHRVQAFRRPSDYQWTQGQIVRDDRLYLVHPSLIQIIANERMNFYVNPINPVGANQSWIVPPGRNEAIARLFVSHSSLDTPEIEDFLVRFEHQLHLTYPAEIWFDKWALKPAVNIHKEIEQGIAGSDLVILMVSAASLRSNWVQAEWRRKHADEISTGQIGVLCVILDETRPEDLPDFLRDKQAVWIQSLQSEAGLAAFCSHVANILHKHMNNIAERFRSGL